MNYLMKDLTMKFKLLASACILGGFLLTSCSKDSNDNNNNNQTCKLTVTDGDSYDEIPNLNFEEWYTGKSAGLNAETYYNPSPAGFWATPNTGSGDLGIAKVPVTVFRVDSSESKEGYAAKLVTGEATLLGKRTITAGSIASGKFEIDINDPLKSLAFGRKFTKKPKKVSGWYKYFPVLEDSASAYCFVTKINKSTCKIDTLGFGRKIFYAKDSANTYQPFSFDVVYKDLNVTPDEIVIYFSSSEAGDEFKGQKGNTLYIDEVHVDYY